MIKNKAHTIVCLGPARDEDFLSGINKLMTPSSLPSSRTHAQVPSAVSLLRYSVTENSPCRARVPKGW